MLNPSLPPSNLQNRRFAHDQFRLLLSVRRFSQEQLYPLSKDDWLKNGRGRDIGCHRPHFRSGLLFIVEGDVAPRRSGKQSRAPDLRMRRIELRLISRLPRPYMYGLACGSLHTGALPRRRPHLSGRVFGGLQYPSISGHWRPDRSGFHKGGKGPRFQTHSVSSAPSLFWDHCVTTCNAIPSVPIYGIDSPPRLSSQGTHGIPRRVYLGVATVQNLDQLRCRQLARDDHLIDKSGEG